MNASNNPLLAESPWPYGLPPFDAVKNDHFRPAFSRALEAHRAEITAISGGPEAPTYENTIVALERAGQLLEQVSATFFGLIGAHTNPDLQSVQSEMAPRLAAHSDAILLDSALFGRVANLYDRRDTLALSAESLRLLERYHLQLVRAGAKLDEPGKERLRAINEQLSSLTTAFQQRLLNDTNARAVVVDSENELDGLSPDAIAAARAAATERGVDGWVLTLVLPTGQPSLAALKNRAIRQRVFEASAGRGQTGEHSTLDLIPKIVRLRAERATLLGYNTHADYVLADRTAKTATAVHGMLDRIVPAAVSNAQSEAASIAELMDRDGVAGPVEPWDWAYYSEQVRKARYDFDMAEMTPYLELDRVVQDGMFYAAERLYGLRLEARPDLPAYHPDVRVFEVFSDDNALGLFLFDPYARPSKRGGAWMSSYVRQSGLLDKPPVAANHLNIPRPPDGSPTLLTFEEVTTLFHEFGHALHGL
ncbi:MAG: peptidyl-dipeptidase Dcp, partial [Myxococcota bacterium]